MSTIGGPKIVTDGLFISIDAANKNCYSGTGTIVREVVRGTQSSTGLLNGTTFNSNLGGSFVFDGVNDQLQWGFTGTAPTNNFTMELWFKPTTTHEIDSELTSGFSGTSGQRYIIYPENRGSDGGAGISAGTNGISVYEHGSAYMPALLVWNSTISSTYFTHAVVTYTNKQPRLYVNGTLVRTGLTSLKTTVTVSVIRAGGVVYGNFPGNLAIYRSYNRPLTAAEILQNYNATKLRFGL